MHYIHYVRNIYIIQLSVCLHPVMFIAQLGSWIGSEHKNVQYFCAATSHTNSPLTELPASGLTCLPALCGCPLSQPFKGFLEFYVRQ